MFRIPTRRSSRRSGKKGCSNWVSPTERGAAVFQNVLAQRYGIEVDDQDVYDVLQHDLGLSNACLEAVRLFIE